MKYLRKISLVFFFLFLAILQSYSCTAFIIEKNGKYYLAKNLDWGIGVGYLHFNSKGILKTSLLDAKLSWISKYNNLTFNQFGKGFPLGGINEKGLCIEELNMPSCSNKTDSIKLTINEFQFTQYILDNCSDIPDVKKRLENLRIHWNIVNLHYLVTDKKGNCLIIENFADHLQLYELKENDLKVLSNNTFNESKAYLKYFLGFGGNKEILKREGSIERFVFTTYLLSKYKNSEPIPYAAKILNEVRQHDTQWSIIYDLCNLKIYFKNCINKTYRIIDFNKLNDSCKTDYFALNLNNINTSNIKFNELTISENESFINSILDSLNIKEFPNPENTLRQKYIEHSNSYLKN